MCIGCSSILDVPRLIRAQGCMLQCSNGFFSIRQTRGIHLLSILASLSMQKCWRGRRGSFWARQRYDPSPVYPQFREPPRKPYSSRSTCSLRCCYARLFKIYDDTDGAALPFVETRAPPKGSLNLTAGPVSRCEPRFSHLSLKGDLKAALNVKGGK